MCEALTHTLRKAVPPGPSTLSPRSQASSSESPWGPACCAATSPTTADGCSGKRSSSLASPSQEEGTGMKRGSWTRQNRAQSHFASRPLCDLQQLLRPSSCPHSGEGHVWI